MAHIALFAMRALTSGTRRLARTSACEVRGFLIFKTIIGGGQHE